MPNQNTQFVHHVLFYLKDPHSIADKTKLLEGLQLLTGIHCIQSYHIGTPAATDRSVIDTSYTFSWICFFESADAEAAYQVDPIHLQFVNEYASLWDKVMVYDCLSI